MALVVGSEAHGVSKEMRERADKVLAIPMYGGKIESLNAGVSASIVMSVVADKLKKL
jgi:TrmH family RNA methyltransferase